MWDLTIVQIWAIIMYKIHYYCETNHHHQKCIEYLAFKEKEYIKKNSKYKRRINKITFYFTIEIHIIWTIVWFFFLFYLICGQSIMNNKAFLIYTWKIKAYF